MASHKRTSPRKRLEKNRKKGNRIRKMLSKTSLDRGRVSEHRIFAAFRDIDPRFLPSWFVDIAISTREEDLYRGIDAWIRTDVGKIPLQIKSSVRGLLESLGKNCHPNNFTATVVSIPNMSALEMVMMVLDEVRLKRDRILKRRGQLEERRVAGLT